MFNLIKFYFMNKKTRKLIVGVIALLFGVGLNLQYALGDYGLTSNSLVRQVLAATTGGNGGGTSRPNDLNPCGDCNIAGGPGANSCACTAESFSIFGDTYQGKSCTVSTFPGYYSCCRKDANGLCKCPACEG